jgi:3-hydroxyacyl-CoA dehydrogenase / enoyl-CoA hydratase / 3-hydroxybutyryl-CoA epimerase
MDEQRRGGQTANGTGGARDARAAAIPESHRPGGAGAALALVVNEDGFARLEVRPIRGNTLPLRLSALREVEAVLLEVEQGAADGSIRVLTIGTPPTNPSLTGYDPDELRLLREDEAIVWSSEAQRILRRLERLPIPTIAAIEGEWDGGAAELALACSYRVISKDPAARLSFPQARLGFVPAWGGTVRLPRLVGLNSAMELILTGRPVGAAEAVDLHLADHAASSDAFEHEVDAYAARRLERGRPPRHRRRRPLHRRLLDETAPGRRLLAALAERSHLQRAGSDPAARICLDLVAETVALPLETAFARESATAGQLIVSSDTRGRIHSQRYTERTKRGIPPGSGGFEGAAVLGAGQTASDLAHLLATAGVPVRIKDPSRDAVRRSVDRAVERLEWERAQGLITEKQSRQRTARISGAAGFGGFGTLDLVLATAEGTGYDPQELLVEAERHVRETCVLAFHDWTASPTRVQRALLIPDRSVALLPAFPIDRFPLLEIAPGTLTSPETVALGRRLARRLSLTSVVVSDETPSPGTRLLGAYFSEAVRLLEEGTAVAQIDAAVERFGFVAGPFHRMDANGTRRALRLLEGLTVALGERMAPTDLLRGLAAAGGTFHRYRGSRRAGPNPSVEAGRRVGGMSGELIVARIVLRLVNEAARILEEGGVTDPGDLEVASIFGLGFPRRRGGILFYAEERGIDRIVADLTNEARVSGQRFEPADHLLELAAAGRGFFGG